MGNSIVFVDWRVADIDSLIAGLPSDSELVILDSASDGLEQIAARLQGRSGLDAVHIISHGSSGSLTLGNGIVDTDDLYTHIGQLESIGKSLTEYGDILLYGCNVAAGDAGIQFITSLAQATGADVAASSNLTGAVAFHGDWVLESGTGTIAPEIGISAFGYAGTLSSPITIRLPFDSEGASIAVTQEPDGSISHTGAYFYNAWDFDLSYGTPVLAVANGTVVEIRETVPDGGGIAMPDADGDKNPLNDDPSLGSGAIGNLVTIRHEVDGQTFYATYMHLQAGSVPWNINDTVGAGEVIGNVGRTGARDSESGDGTHLHFQVGSATALFGDTNYGNGSGDSAALQNIALANQYQVGLVGFDGYGTDLPTTVVGPPAQPVVTGSVVSIKDVQITEGNSGTKQMTFTVTRTGGAEAFDVNYATSDGTAAVTDGDYVGASGTLHFGGGVDTQTISVVINGDAADLVDESFYVRIFDPTSATVITDAIGVGVITNDDADPAATCTFARSTSTSFPGHNGGEHRNNYAFAALRADGSVATWGDSYAGGDSGSVAGQIDGSVDVVEVFSTRAAFAALRADGSVVTWGSNTSGGDSSAVANLLDRTIDVVDVFSTSGAFAALRADGSVVTWGHSSYGGDSSAVASLVDGHINVVEIFSTNTAFAALRVDGSVVTWGDYRYGGDSSAVASQIDGSVDVVKVFSARSAFAALRADGSVVTWGRGGGGNSSAVATEIDGTVAVVDIFSCGSGFAALRIDGSVVTWDVGGIISPVANQIDGHIDVIEISSTETSFAALRADGSVVTWGSGDFGGDSSAVANRLDGRVDVVKLFSSTESFAALRADGSVVTWGNITGGGDSSAVAGQLDGSVDVVEVFSNDDAFAALRADGSVVTWRGYRDDGGNSSAVASQIDGSVDVVEIFSTEFAFAALRVDGSVVTWGDSRYGGNSSAVESQLDGSIDVVTLASPFTQRIAASGADSADDYADEADDSSAPVGIITVGSPITGLIGTPDSNDTYGDKDVFKVLLTQGQSYAIHLQSTLVDGQALPQGLFTLRDGSNFSSILDTSSIGSDVTENFTANTTGYHYIRVGTGGAATDQGGYHLSVTALNEWSIASSASRVAEDSGTISFSVTRPSDVGSQVVYVSTTSREGFTNQSDYIGKVDELLTFAAGERTKTVTITLTADGTAEPNETFGVIVQESASPNLDDFLARQTFTLLNDDSAGWSIDPPSRVVNESDGSFIVSITRPEGGVTQTVYVSTLANQGSVNQGDFTALHNTPVAFIAGETVRPVRIALTDPLRSYAQDDAAIETFGIVVKQASNDPDSAGIASATFSIADDVFQTGDPPTLDKASQIFEDAGGKLVFLAQMAEAAYHLAVHEPLGQLNDISHSEAAADERSAIGQYLQFLSADDLPPELELTTVGGDFPQQGIARFDIDKTGIYTNQNAAAFVGRSEDALFIAFRGTNDANLSGQLSAIAAGGGSPDSDHWQDHAVVNGIGVPFSDEGMAEHYALLAPLIDALDAYIANPDNDIEKIYVTGHSLGAAMVQAYMDQHAGNKYEAITFASPGYEGFADSGFADGDARISNIHIAFDPILLALNLANKERGDEYLITHQGTNLSFGLHSMEAYLAVSEFIAQSNKPDPGVTSSANNTRDVVNVKLSLSQDAQGNWIADTFSGPFYGSDQDDFLFSRSGSDAILGGGGNDFVESGDGDDSVFGESGSDEIKAGTGGGNDYYDGGDDVDTIIYTSTARGIVVNLALPQDQATGPEIDTDQIFNVENVVGGDGDDRITGDSMDNRLEGGSGQDAMDGGSGNDLIHGGDGNDLLNGGRGADQMEGGGGNDIYVVDHHFDQVTEVADSGLDSVSAKANHVLMDNVENLFLTGSVTVRSGGFFSRKTSTIDLSIDGTGNDTDNLLRGNRGHNQLDGLGGNDTLLGGAGADVLQGGMGADRLVGGAGADVFVFAVGDGGSSLAAADMLYDFEDGIDRIALAGGLDFADLTITQGDGTDTAAGNTVIGTSSGEYLAVLLNTSTGVITGLDFQMLGV